MSTVDHLHFYIFYLLYNINDICNYGSNNKRLVRTRGQVLFKCLVPSDERWLNEVVLSALLNYTKIVHFEIISIIRKYYCLLEFVF